MVGTKSFPHPVKARQTLGLYSHQNWAPYRLSFMPHKKPAWRRVFCANKAVCIHKYNQAKSNLTADSPTRLL